MISIFARFLNVPIKVLRISVRRVTENTLGKDIGAIHIRLNSDQ